jgi:DNA polymerase-4
MSSMVGNERTILHVDMDAFYASAEILRRPELRGSPVVVGGAGRRGVVAAASYEARFYGVRSAMASAQAKRLCPNAVFLAGDHEYYRGLSTKIMNIMSRFTPLIEPLSLDEAFLDVTSGRRLFGDGRSIATKLREIIFAEVGLWCSAGVATNKFLAKLASEEAKPAVSRQGPVPGAGVYVVEPGTELDFLRPLPARALWGVGPATMAKLERLGIATVGDIADMPVERVISAVGTASGNHLHNLANARDTRSVEPEQRAKSISQEQTFEFDVHDRDDLDRHLVRMSDSVAARLRKSDLMTRTISIKVRFGDFTTISRSLTPPNATDSGIEITHVAQELLGKVDVSRGIRLLGVGATGLEEEQHRQLTLDDAAAGDERADWKLADEAIDKIRRRFGTDSIGPAVLAKPGERLKTREENENPWG